MKRPTADVKHIVTPWSSGSRACSGAARGGLASARQLVLFVDTDAPVPPARDAPVDRKRLSPLVDRARFEVLVDGKPLAGSSRDFAIDEELLRSQRLSFGVMPAPNDGGVAVPRAAVPRRSRAIGRAAAPA